MNPYVLLGAVAFVVAVAGSSFLAGASHERDKQVRAVLAQTEAARKVEQDTARTVFRAREARDAEDLRTNDRLTAELQRLRSRPERLPATAAATCQGSTGAELSRPDAEVALGLAARADRLRAALGECYAWIDAAEEMTGGHR